MDSEEADTGRCDNKLCRKDTYVYHCEFCQGKFCIEHILPKPPRKPIFNPSLQEDREIMEEYSHPGGHPCPPYYDIWKAKKDADREKYKKALQGFSGSPKPAIISYEAGEIPERIPEPPKKTPVEKPPEKNLGVPAGVYPEEPIQVSNVEVPKDFLEKSSEETSEPIPVKGKSNNTILIIILFFALLVGVYYLSGTAKMTSPPAGCVDGTLSGGCSKDKPYFCSDSALEEKASVCGCPKNLLVKGERCLAGCRDGTLAGECSHGKPLYCLNGSLISKASSCGCPANYLIRGDVCKENLACLDGTLYDECSEEKPLFCLNGVLINRSSVCNCSEEQVSFGNECIPKIMGGPDERTLNYTIRGRTLGLKVTLYKGLNDYLAQLPRTYTCDPVCPSETELQKRFLDEERQSLELEKIVVGIRASTRIKDDQARIAISLVQTIPYDIERAQADNLTNRYPYEVLFENKGLCGEKSRLLALLLRELGYESVLLDYKQENHMAVGIKCPYRYSQYIIDNVSYCFIETTSQTIITDNEGEYTRAGKLTSTPTAYLINKGNSFDDVLEEYRDANDWQTLNKQADAADGQLIEVDYNKWTGLIRKYNIQTTNQTQTNSN